MAPATAVVPPDKFVVPAALSGREGRYRGPVAQCMPSVDKDFDALLECVKAKPHAGEIAAKKAAWLAAHTGEALPSGPLAPLMFLTATATGYFTEI